MFDWLGNFLERLANSAPHIPRPFNEFWKAIGRGDGSPDTNNPPSDS